MIFGIDFDNTIVNYNLAFKKAINQEKTKLGKKLKKGKFNSKIQIKNYLLKNNNIDLWKRIQSKVYSEYIFQAYLNIEILKLLKYLDKKKIKFYIVSHKTVYPYIGKRTNLHLLSKKWLRLNLFNKKLDVSLLVKIFIKKNNFKKKYKSFFETTKEKKLYKINLLKITHFIDDLDGILNKLPSHINKIKFDRLFKFTLIKRKYNI